MITVKELTQTCEACPAQWEGLTTDDRPIYVRYRHGYLSVRLGEKGATEAYASPEIFGLEIGEPLDGAMAYDELKQHTKDVVQWPAYSPLEHRTYAIEIPDLEKKDPDLVMLTSKVRHHDFLSLETLTHYLHREPHSMYAGPFMETTLPHTADRVVTGVLNVPLRRLLEALALLTTFDESDIRRMLDPIYHREFAEQSTKAKDQHLHTKKFINQSSFIFCANPTNCNGAAHGGISMFYMCLECLATQIVNINGPQMEEGVWSANPQQ